MRGYDSRETVHRANCIRVLIVAALMLSFCGCAHSPEDAFKKGDYFGAAKLWLQKAEHGDLDAACRCLAALNIIAEGGHGVKAKVPPLAERLGRVLEKRVAASLQETACQVAFKSSLEKAAHAGNAGGQFLLAGEYAREEGKSAEAERLFELAAENGHPEAQWRLGVKHMFDADQSTLVRWWKLSAAKGYYPALQNLGLMYRDGHGVPQDFQMAAKLFSDGAQQGFSDAQMEIGQMYAKGQGVPQDFVQAHFWFNVAGTKGTEQQRKRANEARDAIAHSMTADQVATAQRLARDWRPKESPY